MSSTIRPTVPASARRVSASSLNLLKSGKRASPNVPLHRFSDVQPPVMNQELRSDRDQYTRGRTTTRL